MFLKHRDVNDLRSLGPYDTKKFFVSYQAMRILKNKKDRERAIAILELLKSKIEKHETFFYQDYKNNINNLLKKIYEWIEENKNSISD